MLLPGGCLSLGIKDKCWATSSQGQITDCREEVKQNSEPREFGSLLSSAENPIQTP
jgi:hypothetical protein